MASQGSSSSSGQGQQQGSSSSSLSQTRRDLDYVTSFLHDLVAAIRNGDDASISRLIVAIRSGASRDQIRQLVEEMSQQTNLPGGRA